MHIIDSQSNNIATILSGDSKLRYPIYSFGHTDYFT
jgi:hypothetical protein